MPHRFFSCFSWCWAETSHRHFNREVLWFTSEGEASCETVQDLASQTVALGKVTIHNRETFTPAAKASTGWLHFRNWQNLHLVWSDKRISGFLWWQHLWYWSWRMWLGLILHKLLSIFGCKWSKPGLDFACLFVFFTVYYNVFAKPKTDPWLTMPSSKYSYPKYINTIFRDVYC